MKFPQSSRPSPSVLALSLEGSRVEAVVVRRTNGSVEAGPSATLELPGDLLSGDPAALARALRSGLDAAGIRERRCVVGLPLDWLFVVATPLPDLGPEDTASLLDLEAERHFPPAVENLMIARAPYGGPATGPGMLQVAVPRERLDRLEAWLRAARLAPASFTLALPPLAQACGGGAAGWALLAVGADQVALGVGSDGGFAALRCLTGVLDRSRATPVARADLVARELRVSLGQLAPGLRGTLQGLRILGPGEVADQLARDLQPRAAALGLPIQRFAGESSPVAGVRLPPGRLPTAALVLGTQHLAQPRPALEFLPDRPSAWQQFAARTSSRKLGHAGLAAAALAALVVLAFGIQQVRLSLLRREWAGLATRVRQIEDLQQQIKRYRPWFDDSHRTLNILRRLTEAFPEDGNVTARSIEIREGNLVSCSGTARDNTALLRTLDQLRAASGVSDVQVEQLRGRSPLQFTFNFRWDGPAGTP